MRQRLVNEKAAGKTLAFLQEVYNISFTPIVKPLSLLYAEYHLSKSTSSICKQLNLFSVTQVGTYSWIADTAPNREMALSVLEVLRRRNDKVVSVPLAGFEDLIVNLGALVNTLEANQSHISSPNIGNYTSQIKALTKAKSDLFSDVDNKHETFIKIVATISGNIWGEMIKKPVDEAELNRTNDFIITAAKDLLTKIYK